MPVHESNGQDGRYWAVYTRVSSIGQLDGVSLAAQEELCRRALPEGVCTSDVRIFREEGESAKDMERPRVKALMEDVQRDRVAGIVAFKLDRLSRNMKDFIGLIDTCKAHCTELVLVDHSLETETPHGKLTSHMFGALAQYERELLQQRIVTSVRHLRAQGQWTGGRTPYGYTLVKEGNRCALIPHPEQAVMVLRMFELVRETRSLSATVKILHRHGIVRVSGEPFDIGTVDRMIHNRVYVGELTHKVVERTKGNTKTRVEYVPGKHEPLVSRELFDAVQRVVYRKVKLTGGSKKTDRVFVLQGLLWCASCRATLTPSYTFHKGRRQPWTFYYRCLRSQKRMQSIAHCPLHLLNADEIEGRVIRAVGDLASDQSGWFEELYDKLQVNEGPATAHLEAERQAIVKEKAAATKELDNVMAFIKRLGSKAPLRLADEMAVLERKLTSLEQELDRVNEAVKSARPAMIEPSQLRSVFGRIAVLLEQATREEQRELLRLFIQRIDVAQDGLVMHVYEIAGQGSGPGRDQSSKTTLEWWSNRDTSRTIALPLPAGCGASELLAPSALLKSAPTMTGLELAEHYQTIMREQGLATVTALARHLGKPYRTIKSIYKLNRLCCRAKDIIRRVAQDPQQRQRLSPARLALLHVESRSTEQVRRLRMLTLIP